jgi:hypothetical protein
MLMISWFSTADEIDFDLDLPEIQGSGATRRVLRVSRTVERHLDKPLSMDREMGNPAEYPALGFLTASDRGVAIAGRMMP